MGTIGEGHFYLEKTEVVPEQPVRGYVQADGQNTLEVGAVKGFPGASN